MVLFSLSSTTTIEPVSDRNLNIKTKYFRFVNKKKVELTLTKFFLLKTQLKTGFSLLKLLPQIKFKF